MPKARVVCELPAGETFSQTKRVVSADEPSKTAVQLRAGPPRAVAFEPRFSAAVFYLRQRDPRHHRPYVPTGKAYTLSDTEEK